MFLLSQSLDEAMFWEVLWALVLGFALSAVLQVFVSKERMMRDFGKTSSCSVALATFFGGASSSWSGPASTMCWRSRWRRASFTMPGAGRCTLRSPPC